MITKIKIRNFKSIKNLDVELRPLNVLIGANGVGKSNFIGFFKLLNRIYEQNLQNYIGINVDALLYFGRKKSEFLAGMIEFSQEADSSFKNALFFKLKPQAQSNSVYIEELGDYFNKGDTQSTDYQNWDYKLWSKNAEESNLKNQKEWRAAYLKKYLESFRIYHFHDTSDTSALKGPSNLNDNRYLAENGRNLAAYLYFLQEKHPKALKKIELQIRAIAPFFDRFDLAPDRLSLQESLIELRWFEKGNDVPFNAHYLSDGTLRFMALATLLLQPDLPKVILIDEPELGLHPMAIHKLSALFQKASAQSQLIISTQSTTLVDNFEPEDIITVDRIGGETQFNRQNKADLVHWLEDYTIGDLWNKNVIGGRP